MNQQTDLIDAVLNSDETRVRALIAAGQPIDQRNPINDTPLTLAAKTDQFVIAEILIDGGADIMAHNRFGWTAGYAAQTSRLLSEGPEGEARDRVISRLRERGFPFPAPRPEIVRAAAEQGDWPPRR